MKRETLGGTVDSVVVKWGTLVGDVFEAQTATGGELFSHSTCHHATTFILLSLFSVVETISFKIWERPMPWRTKCSLPVSIRALKTLLAQALYYAPINSKHQCPPPPGQSLGIRTLEDWIVRPLGQK